MNPTFGFILDLVVVICVTILAAMRIVPGEAVLTLIGALVGARAMQRLGGGGPQPPSPGAGIAATSSVVALVVGLGMLVGFSKS